MNDLQRLIYDIARILLWPVLIAAILCLVWVLIEFGVLLYELWLRFRYRDLDALEARALRARKAFRDGKPRTAYRYLQENNYSLVVVRFLYDLIRNYQAERLEAKPLKLLQEYEFYSVKRLERTRILMRIGPMLGLMGTLIPLSPALVGLARATSPCSLRTSSRRSPSPSSASSSAAWPSSSASSATACTRRTSATWSTSWSCSRARTPGCAPGAGSPGPASGTAKNRMEYESHGRGRRAHRQSRRCRRARRAAAPGGRLAGRRRRRQARPTAKRATGHDLPRRRPPAAPTEGAGLTFDDPSMDWRRDEDPFADLGPVDPEGRTIRPRGAGVPRVVAERHAVERRPLHAPNLGTVMGAPENGLSYMRRRQDRYRRPQR